MAHTPLDTTPIDQLLAEAAEAPDMVDGYNLSTPKNNAVYTLQQARDAVMCLRKLATPIPTE